MLSLFRLKNIYELLLNSYSNPRNFDEKIALKILNATKRIEQSDGIFLAASFLCFQFLNENVFANYREAILNNIIEGYLSEEGYDLNVTHRDMFNYFADLENGDLTILEFSKILKENSTLRAPLT